ncbi:PAS-domain containing protein [Pseudorhodobacter ferrugineus]|uniref:PAS-domain containing protein n=1 Tax=Pseudorhodobacter ferrugineus TaxID=77008 RepID=UPI0003B2F105|nr:PAS-domain containing protein [Pseudorhodobacter ferrugineus]
MTFEPVFAIGLLVTGMFSAFLGLVVLSLLQQKPKRAEGTVFLEVNGSADYLFDGHTLVDATPVGRSLLPKACQGRASAWPGLISYLEQRFPGVTARLDTLAMQGTFAMGSVEDEDVAPLILRAELRGGLTRISVLEADAATAKGGLDPLTRRAIRDELEQLRQISANAPLPIWRESHAGDVIWANANYLDLATERLADDEDLKWPLPILFSDRAASDNMASTRRVLTGRDGKTDRWFDVFEYTTGKDHQFYALPADRTVKAEEGLRAFMQTLTKTFAQLSTGLAIFDQDRKLVLFNPALLDLTGLSPDLLTMRPTLPSFFDSLRESSMIPEPRDYKSWRNQITDIEEAAASGLYEETWSLSSGQTYRVTGRPHPNGALALSFEDISNEMSQTRRYRAELELGQAVIDAVDAAIAVFSVSGTLLMSNAAYAALWGHDPAASLGSEGGITKICEYWRSATAPSGVWDRVEDFSADLGPRTSWKDKARLSDGRRLDCQFSPLSGGAMMATFRVDSEGLNGPGVRFTSKQKMVG